MTLRRERACSGLYSVPWRIGFLLTQRSAKDQLSGLPRGNLLPLVDSKPSIRRKHRPQGEPVPWPYNSPSWGTSWTFQSTPWRGYRDGGDLAAFAIELRRAVKAVTDSDDIDLEGQGTRACLTAMRFMDQVVRDAPYLVGRLGQYAWNAGASWAEIGNHLGVTKQAAWKRCSRRAPRTPTPSMLALQQCVERLLQGGGRPILYYVSWATPLPPLTSRHGALEGLRLLNGIVQQADSQLALLVAEARLGGATWKMIGSTLGVGTQGAHKRFSRPVNDITDAIRRRAGRDWPE
jgi:hypothetical protein